MKKLIMTMLLLFFSSIANSDELKIGSTINLNEGMIICETSESLGEVMGYVFSNNFVEAEKLISTKDKSTPCYMVISEDIDIPFEVLTIQQINTPDNSMLVKLSYEDSIVYTLLLNSSQYKFK